MDIINALFVTAVEDLSWLSIIYTEKGVSFEPNDVDDPRWATFLESSESEQYQTALILGWRQSGFPVLEPTNRLAASLMATHVAGEDLRMPWQSFVIRLPPALTLPVKPLGQRAGAILLASNGIHFNLELLFDRGSYGDSKLSLNALIDTSPSPQDDPQITNADRRSLSCAARLALGCILELEGGIKVARRGLRLSERRKRGEPTQMIYTLGRSVRIDCTQPIREYLDGKRGKSPIVQTLVRGHWKQQSCGPAHGMRKRLHIEPYWRGPEDAPIVVRSHTLDAT